jgi:hypothetical protein
LRTDRAGTDGGAECEGLLRGGEHDRARFLVRGCRSVVVDAGAGLVVDSARSRRESAVCSQVEIGGVPMAMVFGRCN